MSPFVLIVLSSRRAWNNFAGFFFFFYRSLIFFCWDNFPRRVSLPLFTGIMRWQCEGNEPRAFEESDFTKDDVIAQLSKFQESGRLFFFRTAVNWDLSLGEVNLFNFCNWGDFFWRDNWVLRGRKNHSRFQPNVDRLYFDLKKMEAWFFIPSLK